MSRTFQDSKGREWTLEISIPMVTKLRKELSIDLWQPSELTKLDSPETLVGVLKSVCAGQIAASALTDDEFASGIVGDVFDLAEAALFGAIADCYPTRRRTAFSEFLVKYNALRAEAVDRAVKLILAVTFDDVQLADAHAGPGTTT